MLFVATLAELLKLLDMLSLWTCLDIMSLKRIKHRLAFGPVNLMHKTGPLHGL